MISEISEVVEFLIHCYRDPGRWIEKATEMHGKKILPAAEALAS